ncbi:NTP hydrolase family protein [Gemmobacter caeni]|uniref:NTP hydrolase family protein n=1 Tax=Gemmobacter caeni TaxID=589035 RepID=A0A2T6B8S3_9RHOB|nr:DEAD/DEAH box helicase [Gemmobacter caeni]PTX52422.1 NTP hydrolase family protein [Gemmobacter caeni]TWJ02907.1 NTP hydrolase family protein [Gemmobacter caeni]
MSEAPQKVVKWITFPNGEARMKRVVTGDGRSGLILLVGAGTRGEEISRISQEHGFQPTPVNPRVLRYFKGQSDKTVRIPDLAEALGAEVVEIGLDRILSAEMTVNLVPRAPRQEERETGRPPSVPDPETVSLIGLNLRGEEVVRDGSGRFFRRVSAEDGTRSFVHEGEGGAAPLFLRAHRAADLDGIAAGLLMMARHGTLHADDFGRVIDAAIEPGPRGQIELDRAEAVELARTAMLRQITAVAIEAGSDRAGLMRALRLSAATEFVLSRRSEPGQGVRPSAATLSLLRRVTQGNDRVDYRGHPDLAIALPRMREEGAPLQVLDLSDVSADGVSGFALNALSRRPAEGSTILIVPGTAEMEINERLRSDVGRAYGVEAVAEIAPNVADGVRDGVGLMMFFIGDARPEPLEALPQAALRTFRVATHEDLPNLEREVFRSRSRIRDFNRGEQDRAEARAEDTREENVRQRPYMPLSRVGEPFTMIPIALEGATSRALQRVSRDMEAMGGVDAAVAAALGRSPAELGELLTPEQVDAVGMRLNAADRGRGFLLADQTGVGKGRSLAAMARTHIRANPENRVLYFTESGTINVPDVCRDLKAVGAWPEIRVGFLSAGSKFTDVSVDPTTGNVISKEVRSLSDKEQKEIFRSGQWPEKYNLLITTYSKFNCREEADPSLWMENAMNANTMIVLDEAHNALNPRSNTGRNVRAALERVPAGQVVFGTATPARNPQGLNLYKPLLPATAGEGLNTILENIQSGGEVAQESFASMLAEDGVMLRRDHDLSNIEFQVNLPDDRRMLHYQDVMNRFSPIVEGMIDASTQIGELVGRRQALEFRAMVNRGVPENVARQRTNELSQYSLAIGGPLANLARITMNALKIDQVVEVAAAEMDMNRKPLITFHSTNSALLNELIRADEGRMTDEEIAALPPLGLKDQIRRIHDGLYRLTLNGERQDARQVSREVAEAARRVDALIDQLPDDLPVSPVDALKERLEANGMRVGEISGRTLCYRDGRIERRATEERDRRAVIDAFNSGELDVLIYNSAGATGGSYHASPDFKDQRGRTMIELETPVDIIKYVQSQGRGNRYGQVEDPKVVSVMTGLTPEMRIMQQRNGKLRSLGASVDGNRSHPLLLDDVPDLLNKVGDEATRNVLLSMPGLARRLGFTDFAEAEAAADRGEGLVDEGSGTAKSGIESLANRVLARSIMLPAAEQDDLVQRIRMEFDVLIEELESRNANPLKPKEFPGRIDIKATAIFSGQERAEEDLDTSVFLSPLYIATGVHEFTDEAVTAERLIAMVERCATLHGADGFAPYAERIRQNLPTLMRPHLPSGYDMDAALQNPTGVPGRFATQHGKLTDLIWLLENLQPGVAVRFPTLDDPDARRVNTVVDLIPPQETRHFDLASAYKIRLISPGMAKPETMAVSRLLSRDMETIRFRPGLSQGVNEDYLAEFTQMARLRRALPVQVLQGNVLQAINVAKENNLGTVSLYRNMEGEVSRGIVIHDSKVDLGKLPVNLPSGLVAAEAVRDLIRDQLARDGSKGFRVWGGIDPEGRAGEPMVADIIIRVGAKTVAIDMIPLRQSTYEFWSERPGLHEAVHGQPLPAFRDTPRRALRNPGKDHKYMAKFSIETEEGQDRLYRILSLLDGLPLQIDGQKREFVNEAIARINRIAAGVERAYQPGGTDPTAEGQEPEMDAPEPEKDPDFEMDDVRWEA